MIQIVIIGTMMKGLMIIGESMGQKAMHLMLDDILIQKIWIELDFWTKLMITLPNRLR